LIGRIDRIDYHPKQGYRILDYKTADRAKTPKQTHLRQDETGHPQWIDLQLPLYSVLARSIDCAEPLELGYFNLPKEPRYLDVSLADWDAERLQEAMHWRDWVIQQIRAGIFWPPGDPPTFTDAFARLCSDATVHRAALIEASEGKKLEREAD
jgi:hypothetical protein